MKRRYEILLPAMFNDGRDVMTECRDCFPDTLMAVSDRFGAFTYHPASVEGVWSTDGQHYHDKLFLLSVDVDDTAETRRWVLELKAQLLARFEQLEIYVTSHPIEVL